MTQYGRSRRTLAWARTHATGLLNVLVVAFLLGTSQYDSKWSMTVAGRTTPPTAGTASLG